MKLPPTKVLVIIAVIVCLALWNGLRSADQRQLLEAEGFNVTMELSGSPSILIDESREQLAVVFPSGFVKADFDDVDAVKVYLQANPEKVNQQRTLLIRLKDKSADPWRISFQSADKIQQSRKTLEQLLAN